MSLLQFVASAVVARHSINDICGHVVWVGLGDDFPFPSNLDKIFVWWHARESVGSNLVEEGKSVFFATLLQWWEFKVGQHVGDAAWVAWSIVLTDKPCRPPLYSLQPVDVLLLMGIPDNIGIFHDGADKSSIRSSSAVLWAEAEIPTYETQAGVGFLGS